MTQSKTIFEMVQKRNKKISTTNIPYHLAKTVINLLSICIKC